MGRILIIAGVAVLAVAAWMWTVRTPVAPAPAASVAAALSGPAEAGFARASDPREFRFPADHGPHPEFRSEWWYYTGVVSSPDGRRFGYQLTFFRVAITADAPARASAWAAHDLYFAHFAISDIAGGKFHSHAVIARGALGLSGAAADPYRVWIDRWSADGWSPTRLRADADGVAIDLALAPGKPVVLEGDHGLSRKSADNASYYYSLTRMPTSGRITVGGASYDVSGSSWMDREWSTSALAPDQVGWDWFSLQLDDGREVMLYRIRRGDGSVDPFSSGTLIAVDGSTSVIAMSEAEIIATGRWKSPRSGATYPSGWRLVAPSAGLDLEVRPLLADQELDVGFRYWEGAVEVRSGGRPAGHGYVELTGYDQPL
ncbi:MAG: carotenoid 1,2-hydratase [Planctomycetes bacterium]|nr:carotenoid 1,2-hydratase [Planctomycetota bacterium]